jgi:hypothetical protein
LTQSCQFIHELLFCPVLIFHRVPPQSAINSNTARIGEQKTIKPSIKGVFLL